MLHFKPGIVVVLCGFAIASNVERGLREAENLLVFQQFLFSGVVERRLWLCQGGNASSVINKTNLPVNENVVSYLPSEMNRI